MTRHLPLPALTLPALLLALVLLALVLPAPAAAGTIAAPAAPAATAAPDTATRPGHERQPPLRFPADEGAHPDWKTEWWYVTGWLTGADGRPRGFQVTFFRNRGPAATAGADTSAFAPRQILIGHAALADPANRALQHEERIARSSFDLAGARLHQLDVHVRDWRLARTTPTTLQADVNAGAFALHLTLQSDAAPLLQGRQGYSRKGTDPQAFSWYYSLPHLRVQGTLASAARPGGQPVTGEAWLDHEWSDAYVSPGAVGWDWTGLNFRDGSALMAFRMRATDGRTLWSGGTWQEPGGRAHELSNGDLQFTPGRTWTSPATGARYPVEWTVTWPGHAVTLRPLLDSQEMDTRSSTGTAYWEGAVRATDTAGQPLAQGYLELTGYWQPLHF